MHHLPERRLQEAVRHLLADPARVWQTFSGKRLQILAPGELNVHEGPDLRNMVLLLDSMICVGDGEFHRTPQEWQEHGHAHDPRYERVLLHIVMAPPTTLPPPGPPEILVVPAVEIEQALQHLAEATDAETSPEALLSLYELQYFALLRLLRRTSEARLYVQRWGFLPGFAHMVADFFQRYLQKRRRPVHTEHTLAEFVRALPTSPLFRFLEAFHAGSAPTLTLQLHELARQRITTEGAHLRLEILLNCLLPYLLVRATPEQRIELLSWYWSAPARVRYGHLRRAFPTFPQRYMWQQQGMLEALRHRGSGLPCRELLATYSFGDVLEFYRSAEALLSYTAPPRN